MTITMYRGNRARVHRSASRQFAIQIGQSFRTGTTPAIPGEWARQIESLHRETAHESGKLDSPPLSHYTIDSTDDLQQRLANADDYFKRKSIEVLNDDSALSLLASLYQASVVDISDFNSEENGISLAKLTAASFVEIGANVIYITESGQRFIDWIQTHE